MRYLLVLLLSFNVLAQLPNESVIQINGGKFSYYTNKSITQTNSLVERAIITIHGSVRNADTYFKSVWGLSKRLGVEDKTIVVSPHFKISGDQLIAGELRFSYEGWWIGNNSLDKTKTSSFAVIDFFIKLFSDQRLYPNLKELVITGHSAGGHLTQRLALGSVADIYSNHINIKYIVANPGTYAYLTNKRPVRGMNGIFEVPRNPGCAYNNYKYGMDNRNEYMSRFSVSDMTSNFVKRQVTYFLGEQDIGDVEQTCQAALQGPHRLARGINFKDHVDQDLPHNIHNKVIVPGVGHTQYGMYTSQLGQKLLFGL